MVESIFQTLLLLAYFDIALVSIAIANFAVSASLLGRESRLSRWRMEKRKKQLEEKIRELQAKGLPIHELDKETKECQSDIGNIGYRIFLLSYLGAVIFPIIFFASSFIGSAIGMNAGILSQDLEAQGNIQQVCFWFSSGTLVIGFGVLLSVISAIDSAARKLPIPEFEVSFEKGMKATKCKRNERIDITLCIKNKGEDVAENSQIFVMFPPTFKVHEVRGHTAFEQGYDTDYPGYIAAIFQVDWVHIGTILSDVISITPPDEKKVYDIPINIYERKSGVTKCKLSIEVVD